MAEKLVMKDDILFKAFFSRKEKYLKSFLNSILGKDIKIKKVVHDARLEQLAKENKYGIFDLEVELESGEIINIEMQMLFLLMIFNLLLVKNVFKKNFSILFMQARRL